MRFIYLALALMAILAARAYGATPVVTIDTGKVAGESGSGINVYKGIPYAAPPTGNLRWAPPAPAGRRGETLDATEFGPACPQPARPDRGRDFGPQSEDCLTLNVWAPENAANAPVMVWIHGGAFRIGNGGAPFYDGRHFADKGIVFVSINYRLGYLGFFAHPALTAQAGDAPLANYGLMDQVAALKWVQHNIAAFGGDPAQVTIFGESAGASSVLFLMASPEARGLFARAISESGGGFQRPRYVSHDLPNMPSLESAGTRIASALGVSDASDPIAALRKIPAATLIEKTDAFSDTGIGFGPVIDGKIVTEPLFTSFLAGRVAQVPLIIGANSNEASVLGAFRTSASDLAERLGLSLASLRPVYGTEAGGDPDRMADLLFGDVSFVAPARAISQVHSTRAPVYEYHLDFVRERARDKVPGANHGADILLVFNTLDTIPMARFVFTDRDREVARQMNQYWANFARTGNPNDKSLPAWPGYSLSDDPVLLVGNDSIEARKHYRSDALDFAMKLIKARTE